MLAHAHMTNIKHDGDVKVKDLLVPLPVAIAAVQAERRHHQEAVQKVESESSSKVQHLRQEIAADINRARALKEKANIAMREAESRAEKLETTLQTTQMALQTTEEGLQATIEALGQEQRHSNALQAEVEELRRQVFAPQDSHPLDTIIRGLQAKHDALS